MAKGFKTGGRQKGTPNKFTMTVKEGLEHAWAGIGGAEHLTAWARENPTEFYKLYGRLIPQDVAVRAALTVRFHDEGAQCVG